MNDNQSAAKYQYNWPMPAITADIVCYRHTENGLEILLIQRGREPWKGCWSLPGGHLDVLTDPSILHCAMRELREEVGIPSNSLKFLGYSDSINRDPRGRYVTFLFSTKVEPHVRPAAGDDAAALAWFQLKNLPELACDHEYLIKEIFLPNYNLS